MILSDFQKVEFTLFGWHLVEPMALITNLILTLLSIYFAWNIRKMSAHHPFYHYWMWFFLVFGASTFCGAFGHLFYKYWGVQGKIPSWTSGIIAVYCLEQAMIALSLHEKQHRILKLVSFWKLVAVTSLLLLILSLGSVEYQSKIGFLPVAINTIVGISATAGILGHRYLNTNDTGQVNYFSVGVWTLLPSAFVFLLKINIHPWFDKNDLSHLFIAVGMTFFYLGCRQLFQQGLHRNHSL